MDIEGFKIIYPRGMDSLAFRYAFLFERINPVHTGDMGAPVEKIPVVLRPNTLRSNGVVVWAPKRMEIYTTPPASFYSLNWEKQLALHELRHVAQMELLGAHFTRGLSRFIGQQADGLVTGLYAPRWMLEGDAVLSETLLSRSGRGRQASFLMPVKPLFARSANFSWDKVRFGSYKDKTPDIYRFGYLKLSTAALTFPQYSPAAFLDDISRHAYNPFCWNRAFRKAYGALPRQLYSRAVELYSGLWKEERERRHCREKGELLNPPSKHFVHYVSPQELDDGWIYVIKKSMEKGDRLVRIDDQGQEESLFYTGTSGPLLQGAGYRVYWTEQVSGLRWEHENYSVICQYDALTRTRRTLTYKTRYYDASPSPDGTRLAAVHYNEYGGSALHILKASDAALLQTFDIPRGAQLREVCWKDETRLYLLVLSEQGLGIYLFDTRTRKYDLLLAPRQYEIKSLFRYGESLLFMSDADGMNNIYLYDSRTQNVRALTNDPFGAFDPFIKGDRACYISFNHKGYQLRSLDTALFLETPNIPSADSLAGASPTFLLADALSRNASLLVDTLRVPDTLSYPVGKYRKGPHIFGIHSWAPFYYDYDVLKDIHLNTLYKAAGLGAMLMSQNTLGTAVSRLGYSYHDGFHSLHFNFTYSGWTPVLSLSADFNDRRRTDNRIAIVDRKKQWIVDTLARPNLTVKFHSYLPLRFDSRGWRRELRPSLRVDFANDRYYNARRRKNQCFCSVSAGLNYYQQLSLAHRDIFPRWGFGLSAYILSAPFESSNFSTLYYAGAHVYTPGILCNQGLRLQASYQRQSAGRHNFYIGNYIKMPRGMDMAYAPRVFSLSADYVIPAVVECNLPGILYLKRLQGIPFIDYSRLVFQDKSSPRYSYGMELLADFHIFRIGNEITAGTRFSYTSDKKAVFEFLLSIDGF